MRSTKRSLAYGGAALGLALSGAVLTAPSAAASADNYLQFDHQAASLIDTCYEWQGPEGIEKKNYCHNYRPVGDSWKANFPPEATGVTVKVHWSGGSTPLYINEADKNHCYKIDGILPNIHVLDLKC